MMSLLCLLTKGVRHLHFVSKSCHSLKHLQGKIVIQKLNARCLSLGITTNQVEAATTNSEEATEVPDAVDKRLNNVPVETSIKYLQSEAYKETYGVNPVWTQYRRNHKGVFAPQKTRKTCIRQGKISTGNPCPICRDEYLVLDHRNTELLKQFISPHNGDVLSYRKTGLCQKRYLELLVAVQRANDVGLITSDVPFREYDYSQYFKT